MARPPAPPSLTPPGPAGLTACCSTLEAWRAAFSSFGVDLSASGWRCMCGLRLVLLTLRFDWPGGAGMSIANAAVLQAGDMIDRRGFGN